MSSPITDQEASERATLTVPELAQRLGLSESATYQALRRGEIPARRIGRRFIIWRDTIDRFFGEPAPAPDPQRFIRRVEIN